MNTPTITREQIMRAAETLIAGPGRKGLNMRSVAEACGVAVGSLYNYFPTKADLVAALMEDFWLKALTGLTEEALNADGFVSCFCVLYQGLSQRLAAFREAWLMRGTLEFAEKAKGQEKEKACFQTLHTVLCQALDRDNKIGDIWDDIFTKDAFASFAFSHLLLLLRDGVGDIAYFKRLLGKILYQE